MLDYNWRSVPGLKFSPGVALAGLDQTTDHSDLGPSQPKPVLPCTVVVNLQKFPRGVPEIFNSEEWDCEVTVALTFDHRDLINP